MGYDLGKLMWKVWSEYRLRTEGFAALYPGLVTNPEPRPAFDRALFASILREYWNYAKQDKTNREAAEAERARLASADPFTRRKAEIEAELRDMEYRNFIDWDRHRELSAELFSLRDPAPALAIAAE